MSKSAKTRARNAEPVKATRPFPSSLDRDRELTNAVLQSAMAFNTALENAYDAGLKVRVRAYELPSDAVAPDGTIAAGSIAVEQILRRYS